MIDHSDESKLRDLVIAVAMSLIVDTGEFRVNVAEANELPDGPFGKTQVSYSGACGGSPN